MPTTNLIHNPTFGQQGAGWDTEGAVDYSRHYCRINTGQASQSISVTPLATYSLQFYTQVIFKGEGRLVIEPEPPAPPQSWPYATFHPWTKREVEYDVPAGTNSLTLKLIGSAGEVCFDEFNFEQVVLPPNPELIQNPEFNTPLTPWIHIPPGTATIISSYCELTLGASLYQEIVVEEGKTYTFRVLARTPFSGSGVAQLFDTNDLSNALLTINMPPANSFVLYPEVFQVPLGVTSLRVLFNTPSTLHLESVSFKLP